MSINYHNVRDKNGRFTRMPVNVAPAIRRAARKKKVEATTPKVILNGFLIDASMSMSERGKYKSVVTGFNELVAQGKKDASITGIINKQYVGFFGSGYTVVQHEVQALIDGGIHSVCGSVSHKDKTVYYPNMGMTALWESTYKLITKLENELKINPNSKVILTVFTDGEQNAGAIEWHDGTKIKGIIEQKQKEGWVINFIGAGEKVFVEQVATSVGIFASNTLSYANNSAGAQVAMKKMSASRSVYTTAVADGLDSNIGFFSND